MDAGLESVGVNENGMVSRGSLGPTRKGGAEPSGDHESVQHEPSKEADDNVGRAVQHSTEHDDQPGDADKTSALQQSLSRTSTGETREPVADREMSNTDDSQRMMDAQNATATPIPSSQPHEIGRKRLHSAISSAVPNENGDSSAGEEAAKLPLGDRGTPVTVTRNGLRKELGKQQKTTDIVEEHAVAKQEQSDLAVSPADNPPKKKRGRPRKNPAPASLVSKNPTNLPKPLDLHEEVDLPIELNIPVPENICSGEPHGTDTAPEVDTEIDSAISLAQANAQAALNVFDETEPVASVDLLSVPDETGFSLASSIGVYTLDCPDASDHWPQLVGELELTVTRSTISGFGLIAGFDLGIIEGTMLLAHNPKALAILRAHLATATSTITTDDPDQPDTVPDPDTEPGPADFPYLLPNELRAAENPNPLASLDAMAHSGQSMPTHETAIDPDTEPRSRVYFRWRGQNTTDGSIYSDGDGDRDRNMGVLEFSPDASRFVGLAAFPGLSNRCVFTGTKITDRPVNAPIPWETLSDEAVQQAKDILD